MTYTKTDLITDLVSSEFIKLGNKKFDRINKSVYLGHKTKLEEINRVVNYTEDRS